MTQQNYWEDNIRHFSKFYQSSSDENIIAPPGISYLYKKFVFPVEKNAVRKRYEGVISIIDDLKLKEGSKIIDIGCGNGIFTVALLERGFKVIAADFTQSALKLTENNIEQICPEKIKNAEFLKLDISKNQIPVVDLAIAIGVSMYISDISAFYENILPFTDVFLDNYQYPNHWINIIRRMIKLINVREVCYLDMKLRNDALKKYDFKSYEKIPIGTGCIELLKKNNMNL